MQMEVYMLLWGIANLIFGDNLYEFETCKNQTVEITVWLNKKVILYD